ncbi:uncharacterized protein [Neodiprion pinetum]|uniref:uncharacterized protein n=1 Tax=Neodiprion pinetum TaxID=441929 RepID=UPI003715980F
MGANNGSPAGVQWDDVNSASASRIRTGVVTNLRNRNLGAFLDDAQRVIVERLRLVLREEGNMKGNLTLSCKYENTKHDGIAEEVESFNTSNTSILPSSDIDDWFTHARNDLLVKVEDFEKRDSGWSMIEILNTTVNINRYQPLAAGLSIFVELPKDIQRKRAVVNVKNDDERCLLWSITAAVHSVNTNTDRTHHYRRYISEFNCTGITFPATLHDVKQLEKLNNLLINVNGEESQIFTHHAKSEKSDIGPIYLSENLHSVNVNTILLLMLESNDCHENDMACEFKSRFHIAWISKLMYTDTDDSLIHQFNVPNIYDIIKRDVDAMLDTSDCPSDNVYGIPLKKKKRLGLMKDENNGKIITEFIGLRAKLYTFTTMGEDETKHINEIKVCERAKGVKSSTLNTITFDDYKRCLLAYEESARPQCLIHSKKHQVSAIVQKKLYLS